jgi:hypothetical protein
MMKFTERQVSAPGFLDRSSSRALSMRVFFVAAHFSLDGF